MSLHASCYSCHVQVTDAASAGPITFLLSVSGVKRWLAALSKFYHAGYLGSILFEQDLEQPLLGQTLSITSLVDLEGAALRQLCTVVCHPADNMCQKYC